MTPREIYNALRYQLAPIEETTMGSCADGCGREARGSATCAECLYNRLSLVYRNAGFLWDALNTSRVAILDCEEWLEEQDVDRRGGDG